MESQYIEIQKSELTKAYQRAYSLECREGWEAENRSIEYIGSTEKENGRIMDYYKDSAGDYWYSTRHRRENGKIVSAETFIFGEGFQKRERERRRKRYVFQKMEREEEKGNYGQGDYRQAQ